MGLTPQEISKTPQMFQYRRFVFIIVDEFGTFSADIPDPAMLFMLLEALIAG